MLKAAEKSLEAQEDLVKLRNYFIPRQPTAFANAASEHGAANALQYACEHAMPETCRLILHYYTASDFQDDPILWLLNPSDGEAARQQTMYPMRCLFNINQVARILISFGWKLPGQQSLQQSPGILPPTEDMQYFQELSSRFGTASKPSDDLVPKQLHSLRRLPFVSIGHGTIARDIAAALYANDIQNTGRPLVLMFAGPSGHGKTEMAQGIATLLQSAPLSAANSIVIPCGSISTSTELFGLAGAYRNSHIDSALNKFIRDHQGRRGVAVLDEFEKLDEDAQEAFLEPFDTGADFQLHPCKNQSVPPCCMGKLSEMDHNQRFFNTSRAYARA